MADANINPIPIHTPTGLGGMSDLINITESSIMAFRQWSADYKKKLLAAHDETGTPHYISVNGFECFNPIYNMDSNAGNADSACGEFLSLLGFTDENFQELSDIWDEDVVEHIHYKWIPQHGYSEHDFDFFIGLVQGEMSGVDKIVLTHTLAAYNENDFPDEVDRPAKGIIDVGYDILKDDFYGQDVMDPSETTIWEDSSTNGEYKIASKSMIFKIDVKFFDSSDTEIIKEDWVKDSILSIVSVSMNEAVTSLYISKISEQEEPYNTGSPWDIADTVFSVTTEEEISINFASCTYDRYYIDDESSSYKFENDLGITHFYNYYINLLWSSREVVVVPDNEENYDVGMFEEFEGDYYLRTDFEYFTSPDEISYLISAFSYIEVEEEEKKGGFIRGIIGAILFVAGAWMFYHGAMTASKFLWRMSALAIGYTAKKLITAEIAEMAAQLAAQKEELNQIAMDEALAEAARNNKTDIGFDYDFWDKYEISNPFSSGDYNPLSASVSNTNQYTVGGEYWDPHTKLINKKELL